MGRVAEGRETLGEEDSRVMTQERTSKEGYQLTKHTHINKERRKKETCPAERSYIDERSKAAVALSHSERTRPV